MPTLVRLESKEEKRLCSIMNKIPMARDDSNIVFDITPFTFQHNHIKSLKKKFGVAGR